MGRPATPANLIKGHFNPSEIKARQEQEERLKGNDNLVYRTPAGMEKTKQNVYKKLVKELKATGILNNLDVEMLITCCDAIVEAEKLRKIIEEHGAVTVNKVTGKIDKNPAVDAYKNYVTIYDRCCQQLGLSPQARAKLSLINVKAEQDANDPLLKILGKVKK